MNLSRISLPNTCFSCQNYKQQGWKEDPLSSDKNRYGITVQRKPQRFGHCSKHNIDIYWNDRCDGHIKELDVDTHDCVIRSK